MNEMEMYDVLLPTESRKIKLMSVSSVDNENFVALYQKMEREYFYLFRLVKVRTSEIDTLHTIQYDLDNLRTLIKVIKFELQVANFTKLTYPYFKLLRQLKAHLLEVPIYFDYRQYITNRECFLSGPESVPTKLTSASRCRKIRRLIGRGIVGIEVSADRDVLMITPSGQRMLQIYEDQILAIAITDEPQKPYNLLRLEKPILFTKNKIHYFIGQTASKRLALYREIPTAANGLPHIKDKKHPCSDLSYNHYGVVVRYFDWETGRKVTRQFQLIDGELEDFQSCYDVLAAQVAKGLPSFESIKDGF